MPLISTVDHVIMTAVTIAKPGERWEKWRGL
jgi:hypothetical protein